MWSTDEVHAIQHMDQLKLNSFAISGGNGFNRYIIDVDVGLQNQYLPKGTADYWKVKCKTQVYLTQLTQSHSQWKKSPSTLLNVLIIMTYFITDLYVKFCFCWWNFIFFPHQSYSQNFNIVFILIGFF